MTQMQVQVPQGQFTVVLPQGCTTVRIVRPEDGMETIVQFPTLPPGNSEVPLFTPAVLARIDRWREYDRSSPAPKLAEMMVRELGYEVMQPPKSGAELRFVIGTDKGAATLWMNTTSIVSIAAPQTEFAARLAGAHRKAEGRVAFPFTDPKFDGRLIANRFKEWAAGEIH